MNNKSLPILGGRSFEELKQINVHGAEYWSARGLQSLLGYSQWRRFEQAIECAITSCKESGNEPNYHFAGVGNMIEIGKGGKRQVDDFHPEKENLMDRMNATELAANQFRMTQTRDKLSREGIRDQRQAIRTHEQVGKEVRAAIQCIGGRYA